MSALMYITMALLSLQVAHSYILLTANLQDFNAIAKQIAESPVGSQINRIIRRATKLFNREVNDLSKPRKRTDSSNDKVPDPAFEVWNPEERDKSPSGTDENLSDKDEEYIQKNKRGDGERRSGTEELLALGKNASYYLQSIKKIFESV
ncbi:uncharacterized protein LOC142980654 [Anticarsia gemmatalis]|uniref:uncharacterized protein LOC142980654 n=1 Tax=Anticarsia gemmatalis TaxID=129554 RepID=UPI003F75F4F5